MKETYRMKPSGILVANYPVFENLVNEIWVKIYPAVSQQDRGWYKVIKEDKSFIDFDAGISFMVKNGRLDYHGRSQYWIPLEQVLNSDLENVKEETEKAWRHVIEYETTLITHKFLFFSENPIAIDNNIIVPCIHNGEKKWFADGKIISLEDGYQWLYDNGYWENLY